MKKILNEWKNFLKENSEIDDNQLTEKVRDIFFGAYNKWEPEYTMLHTPEFRNNYEEIKKRTLERYSDRPKRVNTVLANADIGLALYWSDDADYGVGSEELCKFLIKNKLEILEKMCSEEEISKLKEGMLYQIIEMVSGDRSDPLYPTSLRVSSGVINGMAVEDAFMTTSAGLDRFVIPAMITAGYHTKDTGPRDPDIDRKPERPDIMTKDDLLAQMKQFDLRK
jgi:hypothetical protein